MIAEMKKLYLLGHNSQKSKILKALYRSKLIEVAETEDLESLSNNFSENLNLDEVNEKLGRLSNAINFMTAQKREGKKLVKLTKKDEDKFVYTPVKVKISESTPRLTYD
mgnify:FL=1